MPRARNALLAAAAVLVAVLALAHAQSCELDLHMAFDTSGSMNDKDASCLTYLRTQVVNDTSYTTRKPCWELINRYVRTSHDLVRSLCAAAGQPEPRVSMVSFRCPSTGKDRKVLLEPTNDAAAVEAAFTELDNQMLTGKSCAFGALDQVRTWVKDAYNQTNREAGVSSAVGDPDAPVTKRPLVLLVTDGLLDGVDSRERVAEKLRTEFNVTLVAANVFPDAKSFARLETLTERGFILDAADADALRALSLRVGSYVTRIEDLSDCSAQQLACARAVRADLNGSADGASCAARGELYTALAGCAATGCVGLDMTLDKDACLAADACDAGTCRDLSTHINAQNYGPDGESGFGLARDAAAPGFMSANRADAAAIAGALPAAAPLRTAFALPQRGGLGAAVADGAGNVLVPTGAGAAADGQAGELLCVAAGSGQVRWRAAADRGGDARATFDAPVAVGGGSVFAGTSDGALYQLDEGSGEVLRVWQLGGRVRAAAALPDSSDYVVAVSDAVPGVRSAQLHKLPLTDAAETGPEPRAWRRPVCNDTEFDFAVGGVYVAQAQGVVVACRNGQVELYSLLTGQERWRLYTGGYIESSPAFDAQSNSLFVAAADPSGGGASLIRFDMTGTEVWRSELLHAVDASPALPPSDSGSVLVLGRNGVLYRYDVAFGGAQAEAQVLPAGAVSDFTPAMDSAGRVVYCAGAIVTVVNASDLAVLAFATLADDVTSAPLVTDGAVFVATRQAALVRLEVAEAEPERRLRRALHEDDADEWPTAAIVVTVVLALLFIVLLSIALAQMKARSRRV